MPSVDRLKAASSRRRSAVPEDLPRTLMPSRARASRARASYRSSPQRTAGAELRCVVLGSGSSRPEQLTYPVGGCACGRSPEERGTSRATSTSASETSAHAGVLTLCYAAARESRGRSASAPNTRGSSLIVAGRMKTSARNAVSIVSASKPPNHAVGLYSESSSDAVTGAVDDRRRQRRPALRAPWRSRSPRRSSGRLPPRAGSG